MYRLFVRRSPCEKWTFWTESKNILVIVKNVEVVEQYGWQWNVKEVEECCTTN